MDRWRFALKGRGRWSNREPKQLAMIFFGVVLRRGWAGSAQVVGFECVVGGKAKQQFEMQLKLKFRIKTNDGKKPAALVELTPGHFQHHH